MAIDLINATNFLSTKIPIRVPAEKVNEIIALVNTLETNVGTAFPSTLTPVAATDALIIDAATTDHTGDALIDIDADLGILSANLFTAVNINADVAVALQGADVVNGVKVTIDGLAADTNGSAISAFTADITSPTTSRADTSGLTIGIDSVRSTDDTDNGVIVGFTGTMNSASAGAYGIRVTTTGMTHTNGTVWGYYATIPNAIASGAAYGAQLLVDGTAMTNPKFGLFVSKDLINNAASGALAQTNSALYISQATTSLTAASGATTVANITSLIEMTNAAALATADVWSGTVQKLLYTCETTGTGTATNSATGLLIDYNIAETAAVLSNTAFNVMYIDFDVDATTPVFASGNYNLLYINGTTGASPAYAATAVVSGTKIDLSAMTVTDADLTLYGLNIAMPAAYGASTESGIHVTGDGTVVDIGVDDATAISITGTVTNGILFGAMATITNIFKFNSIAGGVIANALVPAAAPDAGTMGADACLRVLVNATPYYIPLYDTLHA